MSSVVEQIKQKLDLVTFVGQYVQLKKTGRNYSGLCPFHAESHASFFCFPESQQWRCFGACGTGGDLFDFVIKRENLDFSGALHFLAEKAGIRLQSQNPDREKKLERYRAAHEAAAELFHDNLRYARSIFKYTQDRDLSVESVKSWQLGYSKPGFTDLHDALIARGFKTEELIACGLCGESKGRVYDRFRGRLMIPIRDQNGRIVGFGGRSTQKEQNPKYLNTALTPLFEKGSLLFGLDRAKEAIRGQNRAVVVEGYMDAIQAHQRGFTNVVAQMGTALTDSQVRKITNLTNLIIICLDGDTAGQNATDRSIEIASTIAQADRLKMDLKVITIPGKTDPDDFLRKTPENWNTLIDSAVSAVDFAINRGLAALPPNADRQAKETLARKLLPVMLSTEHDLGRSANIQRLSLRLGLPERAMIEWSVQIQRENNNKASTRQSDANKGQSKRAGIERVIMANLVQNPALISQIRRSFNEIACSALSSVDFTRPDYRLMFDLIDQATQQDDQPYNEFIYARLSVEIIEEYQALCATEIATESLSACTFWLHRDSLQRTIRELEGIEGQDQLFQNNMNEILLLSRALTR